eukprot:403363107
MKRQRIQGLKLDVVKAQETLEEELKQKEILETSIKMHSNNGSQKGSFRNEFVCTTDRSIHDNVNLIEISKIDDNIYISNQRTAQQKNILRQEGITHIINLIAHKKVEDNTNHFNSQRQRAPSLFRKTTQSSQFKALSGGGLGMGGGTIGTGSGSCGMNGNCQFSQSNHYNNNNNQFRHQNSIQSQAHKPSLFIEQLSLIEQSDEQFTEQDVSSMSFTMPLNLPSQELVNSNTLQDKLFSQHQNEIEGGLEQKINQEEGSLKQQIQFNQDQENDKLINNNPFNNQHYTINEPDNQDLNQASNSRQNQNSDVVTRNNTSNFLNFHNEQQYSRSNSQQNNKFEEFGESNILIDIQTNSQIGGNKVGVLKRMQTTKSNNRESIQVDNLNQFVDGSINESNLKTEINMFTFGSENVKIDEEEDQNFYEDNLKYLYLGMRDQIDCDLVFYTYSAIDFIEEALRSSNNQAKILVHCYKGNSRSAAVVAGYLMWKKSLNHIESIEYIRSKRGFIDPNLGFVGQLMYMSNMFQEHRQYQATIQQSYQGNVSTAVNLGHYNLQSPKNQATNQKQGSSIFNGTGSRSNSKGTFSRISHPRSKRGSINIQKPKTSPRIFIYSITKECIQQKSIQHFLNTQTTSSYSQSSHFSNFNAPSPIVIRTGNDSPYLKVLNSNKPLAMVQLEHSFILLVSNHKGDGQIFNQNEAIQVQRGLQCLLILAKHLQKYENGPDQIYIFKDSNITLEQKHQSMIKINKIQSLNLQYPQYEQSQDNEQTIQIGFNSLHVSSQQAPLTATNLMRESMKKEEELKEFESAFNFNELRRSQVSSVSNKSFVTSAQSSHKKNQSNLGSTSKNSLFKFNTNAFNSPNQRSQNTSPQKSASGKAKFFKMNQCNTSSQDLSQPINKQLLQQKLQETLKRQQQQQSSGSKEKNKKIGKLNLQVQILDRNDQIQHQNYLHSLQSSKNIIDPNISKYHPFS